MGKGAREDVTKDEGRSLFIPSDVLSRPQFPILGYRDFRSIYWNFGSTYWTKKESEKAEIFQKDRAVPYVF